MAEVRRRAAAAEAGGERQGDLASCTACPYERAVRPACCCRPGKAGPAMRRSELLQVSMGSHGGLAATIPASMSPLKQQQQPDRPQT